MTMYEQWQNLTQAAAQSQQQQSAFWSEYFEAEKKNYEKILGDKQTHWEGTPDQLAAQFGIDPVLLVGFLDGINSSLESTVDLEALEADKDIRLDILWEKLYFNMLEAKADWLYTLPQWDEILDEASRREITRAYRASKVAVAERLPGRNDPCPCGSGKKYKKCCGSV